MKSVLISMMLLSLCPALAHAQVAFKGGDVHTGSGDVIKSGTVVVDADGKVTAVGADVAIPSGMRVVDTTGKIVTPGFIDVASRLGLVEIWAVDGSRDGDAGDVEQERDVIRAGFRAADAFNPMSVAIPLARAGGVTSVVTLPWGGLVSGQGAYIELLAELGYASVVDTSVGVVVTVGARGGSVVGGSRGGAMLRLREALDEARYWKANRGKIDDGRSRVLHQSGLDSEALSRLFDGEPLFVHVNRASDILAVLALAKDYSLPNVVLLSAREGWMVAKQIAAAKVPVVLYPTVNLPSNFDGLGTRGDNAAILSKAGARVVLSTFDVHYVGNLRILAGNAVRDGLDHQKAIEALTSNAAAAIGRTDVGTLAPGARANLVVWSGDPFEIFSRAESVWIGGREVETKTRQDELTERYRELPRRAAPAPKTKQEGKDVESND